MQRLTENAFAALRALKARSKRSIVVPKLFDARACKEI